MKSGLVTLVTQAAQGHKPRPEGRCPSPEKVLRSECRRENRENQAPAPTTDAAGLAESLNACGAAG
ncbi:MAG: hypothetical protein OXI08_03225, partial [Cyanobacteria bacterium MAG IRC4_bin_6]|nr:hypothetical protein [Cyanobacteria bacterium MAG IRC4_bin_6]